MAYRIDFKSSAKRELAALPIGVRRRLDAAILALADNPRPHGVKKLSGGEGLYRVRAGDYRVVYAIHDQVLVILVVRIAHRRDVYRGL